MGSVKSTQSGVVMFLMTNEGSKSESRQPFLYKSKDSPLVRLMRRDDNPFENNGLSEYDGKTVEIEGVQSPTGTFVVDGIRTLNAETQEPVSNHNLSKEGEER